MESKLHAKMVDMLITWAKDGGINLKMGDLAALATIVTGVACAAVAGAVAEEREAACRDVCPQCNRGSARVGSARVIKGMEWVHDVYRDNGDWSHHARCAAQPIRARAAASAEAEEE